MNERMELALERLAGIPEEKTVPEPYGDYFRRVAGVLLSVRKDADSYELYQRIMPER